MKNSKSKDNKLHPAVRSAKKQATGRFILFAVLFVISAALVVGGIIFMKNRDVEPIKFSSSAPVNAYVKSDIQLTTAMFEQDILDDENKVTGTRYYVLAVDTEGNKFILSVEKEYYETNLAELEDNAVQDIEGGLEILDYDKSIEVRGKAIEMSSSLKDALNSQSGENGESFLSVLPEKVLEVIDTPIANTFYRTVFVFAAVTGVLAIFIFISAIVSANEYNRLKKKHTVNNAK